MSTRTPASTVRRTEAETRALVSDAVVAHVASHGIGALPDIPMERILEEAGVSRASAYRIWPGRASFAAFALERCAAGHAMATLEPGRALRIVERTLAAHDDRVLAAADFVATAADEELTVLLASDRWRAFAAFLAVATAAPSPAIATMLADIDAQDLARLQAFYEAVAEGWGLEPVSPNGHETLAAAALLVARSTVAHIVAGGESRRDRTTYTAALAALVRGSFRERQGAAADLPGLARRLRP